jgi:mycofactocin precursor
MKDRLTTQEEAEAPQNVPRSALEDDELVADDLLVQEVSIDGMCGVY